MQKTVVTLRSGKKVAVRELSALEDTLAFRMVGPDFDEENKFGSGVTVRAVQVALSVTEVDGKDVSSMRKLDDVFEFMAQFGKKDWAKITDAYFEMNEADDEGE